jgi:hypothetical protein
MTRLTAMLHPVWKGGPTGYRYDVTYNGELIVRLSRDPETDLARALLQRGIAGVVTLLDGKTGKSRLLVNIERAATLYISEEDRDGLRCRKEKKNPDISPPAPESCLSQVPLSTSNRGRDLGHYPGSKLETSPQQKSEEARGHLGQRSGRPA